MKAGESIFVVVRYSEIDGFDAASEIDKILSVHGRAWFAKFGQPLSQKLLARFKSENTPTFLMLVTRERRGGYRRQSYEVKRLRFKRPNDGVPFPEYYAPQLRAARTCLQVVSYVGPTVSLGELVTTSSGQGIDESLRSSWRGHFLCNLRPGN